MQNPRTIHSQTSPYEVERTRPQNTSTVNSCKHRHNSYLDYPYSHFRNDFLYIIVEEFVKILGPNIFILDNDKTSNGSNDSIESDKSIGYENFSRSSNNSRMINHLSTIRDLMNLVHTPEEELERDWDIFLQETRNGEITPQIPKEDLAIEWKKFCRRKIFEWQKKKI